MARRKLTKDFVNGRLFALGWEIPDGYSYNGMGDELSVLQCMSCGNKVKRLLRNVFYRQEECLCHGYDDAFETEQENDLEEDKKLKNDKSLNSKEEQPLMKLHIEFMSKMNQTMNAFLELLKSQSKNCLENRKNRKDNSVEIEVDYEEVLDDISENGLLTSKQKRTFLRALRPIISKKGFKKYQSKMTPKQWSKVSYEVAELFLDEFFKKTGIDLMENFLVAKDTKNIQGDKLLAEIIPAQFIKDALELAVVLRMKN